MDTPGPHSRRAGPQVGRWYYLLITVALCLPCMGQSELLYPRLAAPAAHHSGREIRSLRGWKEHHRMKCREVKVPSACPLPSPESMLSTLFNLTAFLTHLYSIYRLFVNFNEIKLYFPAETRPTAPGEHSSSALFSIDTS